MILRAFYLSLLILFFKSVYCHNFESPNSNIYYNNNYDLDNWTKTVLQDPVIREELNLSPNITYEQLINMENVFENNEGIQSKNVVRNFYLFTRDNHDGLHFEIINPLNVSTIKNSTFKQRQTYFIIHGFLGYGLETWILTMKDKLLQKEDCNVISVDWPAGSAWWPNYEKASRRVSQLGNDTAVLINSLIEHKELRLESVHCIGHSLGAHVCGFSGKPFMGRLGRISGLDPAGPRFHNLNFSLRLDKSDAIYVDVIHTNACNKTIFRMDCFGLDENVGHSNFFPNGGRHQPACSKSHKGLKGDIGCHHEMAYLYYMASLDVNRSTGSFLTRPCENWTKYESGNCSCGKIPQYMGFNVNPGLNGSFYLETLAYFPFAKPDKNCSIVLTSRARNIDYILVLEILGFFAIIVMAFTFLIIKWIWCKRDRNETNSFVEGKEAENRKGKT